MRRFNHYISILYLLLLIGGVNLWFTSSLRAQTDRKSVLTGRVTDVQSGEPLDNAIVYLANTGLGNSSGKDGRFRVSFIPDGKYELVVSRAGYEQQTISISIVQSDSIYYEIKLQPRPIPAGEVEVLGKRTKQKLWYGGLLFPKDNPQMYTTFVPGSLLPIGVFTSDSAYYMYSLETTIVDSQKLIRLWLLYKNTSTSAYHFNPMESVKMHIESADQAYSDICPLSPALLNSLIDTTESKKTVRKEIGQSLGNVAIQHARILAQMGLNEFNVEIGMNYTSQDTKPDESWSISGTMYNTFESSMNDGVLERYIVYPGLSVNGFLYFPFPGSSPGASFHDESLAYTYRIEIMTQSGSRIIEFQAK